MFKPEFNTQPLYDQKKKKHNNLKIGTKRNVLLLQKNYIRNVKKVIVHKDYVWENSEQSQITIQCQIRT